MMIPSYRAQADLLLQVLPHVAKEDCFALKGGTAINMFVWDMPRLSVDLDLTYLPFDNRDIALKNIGQALRRIKERIETTIPSCTVKLIRHGDGQEAKLTCQIPGAQIKIEVNTVMRGHVFELQFMDVVDSIEQEFGRFVSLNVLSPAELFGGKVCAALDRQHPRDLFDIRQLYEHGGLSDEILQGVVIGLLSSPRPIHEMVRPHFHDQKQLFETQFAGMTRIPFSYEDFKAARNLLVADIHKLLSKRHRQLLLQFMNGEPDWDLFSRNDLEKLPAVQWKLSNVLALKTKNPAKHSVQLELLKEVLAEG